MNKKIYYLYCMMLIMHFSVYGAQVNLYSFDRITIEDGLSQGTITSIVQDDRGFMWFGTYDGLNRYDGVKFKVYKSDVEDSLSLSHNSITSICEDSHNNLWIGTMAGGLNLYNWEKDNFIRFQNDPYDSTSLNNNIVQNIFEDNVGNLWLGTWGGGLNLYNREKSEFRHFMHDPDNPNSLPANFVNKIAQDKDGNLWLATSHGISKFNYSKNQFENFEYDANDPYSISKNDISALLVGSNGYIWAGTWGKGINRFNPNTRKAKRFLHDPKNPGSLSHNIIRSIFEDHSGNLLAATWGGGLEIFDMEGDHFQHVKNEPTDPRSLSNNFAYSIYQDKTDILWIGVDYKGINKFDKKKQKFLHYKKSSENKEGLNSNTISAIHEGKDGIIWLGTSDGLNRFDPGTKKFISYVSSPDISTSLSNNVIKAIAEDDNYLWLATEIGLNRFNPKTGKIKRFLPDPEDSTSLSFHNVWQLLIDSHNTLWVGTYSGGLNRFNRKSQTFTHFKHDPLNPHSIGSNFIWSMIEDNDGNLWLGTDESGVCRFDIKNNTFTTFKHDVYNTNSISDNKVISLLEDNGGIIWMGTTGGLNCYNRKKNLFKCYTTKDGLPSNCIQGILQEDDDNLWISTNNGLSKFKLSEETFQNFNESNGLQSNEFAVNSCVKTHDGFMYFGGINGFNFFNPKNIDRNPFIPPVVITDLKLFNKDVPIGAVDDADAILKKSITETEEITLAYDQNVFSFEFAALSYSYPLNNQYAYMMENFDNDWNYVGNRNFVTYTNLPAGLYHFKVKASNNDGVWNEQGTSLAITVKPPYWATWWFRIIAVGLLIYILFAYQRSRTKIFKQQNILLEKAIEKKTHEMEDLMEKMIRQEKLAAIGKISGSIAHELRNPLGAVKQSAYYLKLKLKHMPDKIAKHLTLIEDELSVADKVIDDLMEMTRVKSANKEYAKLKDIINESIERVKIKDGIEIKQNLAKEAQYVVADVIQLRQVFVNLINNSNQAFTDKGIINISSSKQQDNNIIEVEVADNGPGIPTDFMEKVFEPLYTTKAKGTGLGLNICKQIIEKHGGDIKILSEVNMGTKVRFTIPVGNE